MFCSKCKAEYEDWVKICADCDVPLVASLPPEISKADIKLVGVFKSTSIQEIEFVKSMLETEDVEVFAKEICSLYLEQNINQEIRLSVREEDQRKASGIIKDYISNQKPLDYTEYKSFKKKIYTCGNKDFYLARRDYRFFLTSTLSAGKSI